MPQLSQSAINELLGLIAERRAACAKDGKTSAGLESVQVAFESLMAKGQGSNLFWVRPAEQERVTAPVVPMLTPVASAGAASSPACHVLIEGDNFHALQVLQHTHHQAVDIIYIDPPYNTGNKDFKYNDSFVDREDGYRHAKWLSFMSKRLRLAKNLLKEDGLLFISIDDNENAQLKLLCDEIFGEKNRLSGLGELTWFYEGVNDNNAFLRKTHETILAYSKSGAPLLSRVTRDPNVTLSEVIENSVVKNGSKNPPSEVVLPAGFPCALERGTLRASEVKAVTALDDFVFDNYSLTKPVRVISGWSSKNILLAFIEAGFKPVKDSKGQLTEFFITPSGNLHYRKSRDQAYVVSVLRGFGTVAQASEKLAEIGVEFSYPKPLDLIKYIISMHGSKSAVVLDFFAGSGTTGHAVMQLNADDGGTRQCILVTNNEVDRDTASKLAAQDIAEGSAAWEKKGICQAVTWPRISGVANKAVTDISQPRFEYFRLSWQPLALESQEYGFRIYGAADKAEARAKVIRAQCDSISLFPPVAWLEAGARGSYDLSAATSGRGHGFVVIRRASELPEDLSKIGVVYLLTDTLVEQPGASLSAAATRVAGKFPADQKVKVKELWIDYMKNFPVEEK